MAISLDLASIYAPIEGELERAREMVRREWTDAFQLVYGPSSTPPRLGGKLMRPAMCLFGAGACGADDLAPFVDMAAATELLHLASLAHDDVVDRADTRRGERALNRLWDNHTAVLGGDYLVARALDILTVYDSSRVIKRALWSIHQMAEGELINFGVGKDNLGEADCIRLAEKKTASLIAVACNLSAIELQHDAREALHGFGMGVGVAFQIADDLLDLEQDEATLGKPSCGDIVEGKTTVPIVYIREQISSDENARIDAMKHAEITDADRAWIRERLESTGAGERTRALAQRYLDDGLGALATLPHSPHIDALRDLAAFALARQS